MLFYRKGKLQFHRYPLGTASVARTLQGGKAKRLPPLKNLRNLRFELLDTLHAHGRQPRGGAAAPRDEAVRSDFEQGRKDEGAQMHARMWHLQVWRVDYFGLVEQEVEIERARSAVEIAAAAESRFDVKQGREQRARRKLRFQGGDRVDEVRLTVNAHRRGAIKRGSAQQA